MMATTAGTGIYIVVATTASGRVLDEVGTADEVDDWLAELGSAETVMDVDMHEMTDDELEAYGPVWDSPGTSEEDDEAPLVDDM